eukprot:gene9685-20133_t
MKSSIFCLSILCSWHYSIAEKVKPLSVNFHFTRKCNYGCGFCFHTSKTSHVEPLDRAKSIIRLLREAGAKKLNFAGGEPFLPEYGNMLGEMIKYAKSECDYPSVSIISNGFYIEQAFFQSYGPYLDILGVSCDSQFDSTNKIIGRGHGSQADIVKRVSKLSKSYGTKFKINTVINSYNYNEDMSDFINEVDPMRWKIFQVLPLEGENIGFDSKRNVSRFLISDEQFQTFVSKHKQKVKPGIMKVEDNNIMKSSYFLVDEYGRFLDSSTGSKIPTRSILDVGVDTALGDLLSSTGGGFNQEAFIARDALFEQQWSRNTSSPFSTSTSSCSF